MEEQSILDKLGEKVSQILQQYHDLQGENEVLNSEVAELKEQNEIYAGQVDKLEDDIAEKDMEIEEIVNKIESILG